MKDIYTRLTDKEETNVLPIITPVNKEVSGVIEDEVSGVIEDIKITLLHGACDDCGCAYHECEC